MAEPDIHDLVKQLQHKSSPKRRAAAKKLRTLKVNEAGPALLAALKKEIQDKRTWETQYQIIMAVGESGFTEALGFLITLVEQKFEAAMIYVALGDAITRLSYLESGNLNTVIALLNANYDAPLFNDGLTRAIAMLRLRPPRSDIDKIIGYFNQTEATDNSRTWIASAAAGWSGDNIINFLNKCVKSDNQQTAKAARAALEKQYVNWSIL